MQTCRRLPYRPLNEKQNRGQHPDGHQGRRSPAPAPTKVGIASASISPAVTSPASAPLHHPPAARRPDEASGLSSCRGEASPHHFRPAGSRASNHAFLHPRTCKVAASPLPPSQLMRGRSPDRVGTPRSPWPWGSARPPALVALARAILRACAHPRASMVCGVAHRPEFIFPRPRPRAKSLA